MTRTEWEYLEVVARHEAPQRGALRELFGSSRRGADYVARYGGEELAGVTAILNRVGEHGWELVDTLVRDANSGVVIAGSQGVVPTPPRVVLTLLFKRPKQ